MTQPQEYTIGIFGGFYNPNFSGWKHTDSLIVRASSLEHALQLGKEQVKQKLKEQFNIEERQIETIINYVEDSNNKIVYQTAWDETNPLLSSSKIKNGD